MIGLQNCINEIAEIFNLSRKNRKSYCKRFFICRVYVSEVSFPTEVVFLLSVFFVTFFCLSSEDMRLFDIFLVVVTSI